MMKRRIVGLWMRKHAGRCGAASALLDTQAMDCVEAICRRYSGTTLLSGLMDVTYTVRPKVADGEIDLEIHFHFDVLSRRMNSAYASKCVHNNVYEFCHNFPTDTLHADIHAALAGLPAYAAATPPMTAHRKTVKVAWSR